MLGHIFLVFRTPTLLVTDINVTFLYAEKKNCLWKDFSENLCCLSAVFSDITYVLYSKINTLCDRI